VPLSEQVAVLYAGTQGHADKVPVARVREWEAGFVRFLKSERAGILEEIDKQKALDDHAFARLNAAVSTFNHQFGIDGYKDEPDPATAGKRDTDKHEKKDTAVEPAAAGKQDTDKHEKKDTAVEPATAGKQDTKQDKKKDK
jgi:hypothetical protein